MPTRSLLVILSTSLLVAAAAICAPSSVAQGVTPSTTGTGTTNYITRWISATAQGNSNIYQNTSGWLGVNTKTPKMTFDINNGNMIARGIGNFASGGNQASVYVGDTSHGVSAYRGNSFYTGGTGLSAYSVPNALYVQDSTGNVGIGTTNPRYPLDVTGGAGIRTTVLLLRDTYDLNKCIYLYDANGTLSYYTNLCN